MSDLFIGASDGPGMDGKLFPHSYDAAVHLIGEPATQVISELPLSSANPSIPDLGIDNSLGLSNSDSTLIAGLVNSLSMGLTSVLSYTALGFGVEESEQSARMPTAKVDSKKVLSIKDWEKKILDAFPLDNAPANFTNITLNAIANGSSTIEEIAGEYFKPEGTIVFAASATYCIPCRPKYHDLIKFAKANPSVQVAYILLDNINPERKGRVDKEVQSLFYLLFRAPQLKMPCYFVVHEGQCLNPGDPLMELSDVQKMVRDPPKREVKSCYDSALLHTKYFGCVTQDLPAQLKLVREGEGYINQLVLEGKEPIPIRKLGDLCAPASEVLGWQVLVSENIYSDKMGEQVAKGTVSFILYAVTCANEKYSCTIDKIGAEGKPLLVIRER